MLTAAWYMLRTGESYQDPGPEYLIRLQRARTQVRAISQPEAMGFTVNTEPTQQTA